jgi:hypothetical protein
VDRAFGCRVVRQQLRTSEAGFRAVTMMAEPA